MRFKTDIENLRAICSSQVLGATVSEIRWRFFDDRATFYLIDDEGYKKIICIGKNNWKLISLTTGAVVTSKDRPFEEFSNDIKILLNKKITKFEIHHDDCLAFTIEFDDSLKFVLDHCCRSYRQDFDLNCWDLSCSDGHVILVGIREGKWARIRKTTRY